MRIVALDIGEKRIGTAYADTRVRIAIPREMIPVDGNELANIAKFCRLEKAEVLVSGYPRNSQGEATKQTEFVVGFVEKIKTYFESIGQALPRIYFQDESLTSVTAEERLSSKKHELSRNDRAKGIVDSEAATIILQDFIENTKLD
ncbi:MAG: Holliday junction resolvase RuvX [Candidatus Saccharibacteria bacterium]|nr:Holliday junction resolvase RuvX [Candidatus Saccharibacteria bacterium]